MPPKHIKKTARKGKKDDEPSRKLEELRKEAQRQEELRDEEEEDDEEDEEEGRPLIRLRGPSPEAEDSDRDSRASTSRSREGRAGSSRDSRRDTGKRTDQQTYSFRPDEEEMLVAFYIDNPCLWDKASQHFMDKAHKEKVVEAMARTLKCDSKYFILNFASNFKTKLLN